MGAPVSVNARRRLARTALDPSTTAGSDVEFEYRGQTHRMHLKIDQRKFPGESASYSWNGAGEVSQAVEQFHHLDFHSAPARSGHWRQSDSTKYLYSFAFHVKYNPPAGVPTLDGLPSDGNSTEWKLGVVLNARSLVYEYKYGPGETFGGVFAGPFLDVTAHSKAGLPWYSDAAVTDFTFGELPVSIADDPSIRIAESYKGHNITSVSMVGMFTMGLILRRTTSLDVIHLWSIRCALARTWGGGALSGISDLQRSGKGLTSFDQGPGWIDDLFPPVFVNPTANQVLSTMKTPSPQTKRK